VLKNGLSLQLSALMKLLILQKKKTTILIEANQTGLKMFMLLMIYGANVLKMTSSTNV